MADKKPPRGKIVNLSDKRKENAAKGKGKGKGSTLKVVGRVVPHTGKEEHAKLRGKVLKLKGQIDGARWELCALLSQVRGSKEMGEESKIYQRWGYSSFDKYVATEVGMTVRTAQYLVDMYRKFEEKIGGALAEKDPKEKKLFIDAVKELGWTKARMLVPVITVDNAMDWVNRAKEMTSVELEKAVKLFLKSGKAGGEDDGPMKRMTFVLAEEQLDAVENALQKAEELAESDKRGHLLAVICLDFYSTNMAQTTTSPEGRALLKSGYFGKMGALLEVDIVAVDKKTGKVIHGSDALAKLKIAG